MVPYTLSMKNKEDCIVTGLLLRQRNYSFFKNIITTDEKLVFFLTMFYGKAILGISTLCPKGRASWKKKYVVFMVGWQRYYSFWIFKLQWNTQCRLYTTSFSFSTKLSEWQKIFSRRFGEIICRKPRNQLNFT